MIVVITEAAEVDLEAIGDWIAADNPQRAASFVRELREKCERLADHPQGFAMLPRYRSAKIRRRPYRDYLIFYRISGSVIEVLHVLHGARDYESILFTQE
jgi:toxin ParE1/3/4